MKKLYAFKNIQQLVKLDTPSSKTRAKELSLENNFVTDLTSLVIPSQREEEVRVDGRACWEESFPSGSSAALKLLLAHDQPFLEPPPPKQRVSNEMISK